MNCAQEGGPAAYVTELTNERLAACSTHIDSGEGAVSALSVNDLSPGKGACT